MWLRGILTCPLRAFHMLCFHLALFTKTQGKFFSHSLEARYCQELPLYLLRSYQLI